MPAPAGSDHTDITETANDASITRQAIPPETDFGSRFPRKALTRKPDERAAEESAAATSALCETGHGRRHEDHKDHKFFVVFAIFVAFVPQPSAVYQPHYHFNIVKASGLSVSRCRKSAMTSARPTAASAAATVMTKNTMIWPSTVPW